jgi:hypothetical protein
MAWLFPINIYTREIIKDWKSGKKAWKEGHLMPCMLGGRRPVGKPKWHHFSISLFLFIVLLCEIASCCDVAVAQINYPNFKHNTQDSIEQVRVDPTRKFKSDFYARWYTIWGGLDVI